MSRDDSGAPDVAMTPAADALLLGAQRRLRTVAALHAAMIGLVGCGLVVVVAPVWGRSGRFIWLSAAAAAVVLAGASLARARNGWARVRVAADLEWRAASFDNLLISAVQLEQDAMPVHAVVSRALARELETRTGQVALTALYPLGRLTAIVAVVAFGTALTLWSAGHAGVPNSLALGAPSRHAAVAGPEQASLRIVVTPPAYTGRPRTTAQDVQQLQVLEGSRIQLELTPAASAVQMIETGQAPVTFATSGERRSTEFVADRTRFVLLRSEGSATTERLLAILVTPDAAPIVRIRQPAKDLLFAEPRGRVAIEIEATDDLALRTLALRYTRAAGAGESLTFQEGELPLRVQRIAPGKWEARVELSLEGLGLEDGDTVAYRAITTDLRPGRDPSISEAYLLEVGKVAQVSSAGFALPEDKDRQALSQQMLIVKTERLHAQRGQLPADEFQNQSRLLGVEQRMVRAEFIFMTGGEVQDEIAEAEHSHDLAEGRFENEGQVELLTAIREMSRAEARLNDGATEPALVFEKSALKALQRAFDRRRYLLRTTPERARIDQTRRLSGALKDAQSWRRPARAPDGDEELRPWQALARDLAVARRSGGNDIVPLAARLGAIDPNAADLQRAALALSASATADVSGRVAAIDEAMRLVAAHARHSLTSTRSWLPHDSDAGHFADAMAARSTPR